MENRTPHSHIQQLSNHPTTKNETASTTQNNNTKTTQNELPLPSPHHTYEKLQTSLDTQTSKSVTNATTQ